MTVKRTDISIKTCDTWDGHWCSFGSHGRRPEGDFVFIEKADGKWPHVLSDEVHQILDALSNGEEVKR